MISRGNFSPVGSTELAEIDENLIRCNLTPAQEAAAVFRRKFIYEQLHPETKAEANASNARKTSDNLSFVPATSDATGKDRRTVERAAARGEALGEDLNDIAGTSLDEGVELDALVKPMLDIFSNLIDLIRSQHKFGKIAMDPVTNPFAPGAGSQPPELSGRDEILERTRITLGRVKAGRNAKSFMLVGLRGVGKTVLLNKIQSIAEENGFIASLLETPEQKSLPDLLYPCIRKILFRLDNKEKVNEFVKRGMMVLRSFANSVKISYGDVDIGLGIEPERGVADSGDLETDLPDLFEAVGIAAKARDTAVAIIIDELQYVDENEFSALIMAMHRISQKSLPVVLIGAGLPQLVGLAGKSKSYAERLFDYPVVDALPLTDANRAILEPAKREFVDINGDALARLVSLTHGYPYFLQEWGYHTWNTAPKSPITIDDVEAASAHAIRSLDESFFRVRFDRVTPREKDYLFAMASLGHGPHRSGDISSKMSVAVESIAPVRSSLIKKGMVFSPAHGDTAFTVPLFDEYLKRVSPQI